MNHLELERLAEHTLLVVRVASSPVTLSSLSKMTGADEAHIRTALEILHDWGYKIKRTPHGEAAFVSAPDILSTTEISYHLKSRTIVAAIHSYRTTKSTNDIALQLADDGADEGTIVTAEEQTKGRGRLGRVWHSPAGMGIYVSIILRPTFKPEEAPGISLVTALALAGAISELGVHDVKIKWPNDILINGKKTAGILTELSAERGSINHLIVGAGINVNHKGEDFPDDIRSISTSLRRVLKHKVSRVALLVRFLALFQKEYSLYSKHRLKKSHARLVAYSSLIGQPVTVQSGRTTISGIARDIDATGALVLQTADGVVTVNAGEVTVVKR
jgi:BirA family transcriptional regulator, biotin operon repressor / biotin---[acetyl-CoA-carboxylase] ligase